MTTTPALSGLSLVGHAVFDPEGAELGEVAGVYLDNASGQPEWAALRRPGAGISIVPMAGAAIYEDSIDVPFTRHQVEGAPYRRTRLARQLSEADEEKLYRHYGQNDAQGTDRAMTSTEEGPGANKQVPPVALVKPDQGVGVASPASDRVTAVAAEPLAQTPNPRTGLGDVLESVVGLARRRPGLLLVATAATGLVAGRAFRSARAGDDDDPQQQDEPAGEQLDPAALDALSARLWPGDVDERPRQKKAPAKGAGGGGRRRRPTTTGGG